MRFRQLPMMFAASALDLISCSPKSSAERELAITHIQQEKLLCVPASASMILAYYGDTQSPRKLKVLAEGRQFDPSEPFEDFTITMYRDLIKAVGKLGYEWRERSLANDTTGFETGINLIRSELLQGHPIMIDLSVPYGHTVVVSGLNDERRTLTLIDPEQHSPGKVSLNFDQLRNYWSERAYGGNFRSLVLTRPR